MKDNKLPVMSDEEREKAWKELKEGQILVYIDYNIWRREYDIIYYNITKITAKKSVRLNNGELLKNFNSKYHVITTELNKWIENQKIESDIMNLFFIADRNKNEFKENLTIEDAKTLKEILERTIKR